jgi:hypothetical protein
METKYKGWIIQKNEYNYDNNSYMSYEYYNSNDCDCTIRHCSTVDDCKENIDYLINKFYY